jgi:hypothetical protein
MHACLNHIQGCVSGRSLVQSVPPSQFDLSPAFLFELQELIWLAPGIWLLEGETPTVLPPASA